MENDFSHRFGKRFQKIVGRRSKLEIGGDLHCSDVTVRFWLKGRIPFAIWILKRIHDMYGVDLNELITGKETKNDKNKNKNKKGV